MTDSESARWSNRSSGDALWMEDMLMYCAKLLTRIANCSADDVVEDERGWLQFPVRVGPEDSPFEYGIDGLLDEIRKRRPLYCDDTSS